MRQFELIDCNTERITTADPFNRCVDKRELAGILSISVRTIEKESHRIVGRRKIGRSVVYYLPEIYRALESGKPVFGSKKGSTR